MKRIVDTAIAIAAILFVGGMLLRDEIEIRAARRGKRTR